MTHLHREKDVHFGQSGMNMVVNSKEHIECLFLLSRNFFTPLDLDLSANVLRGAVNGFVLPDLALSAAIRYFAGGQVLDIAISHRLSTSEVYQCIWDVVDLINESPELSPLKYPSCYHIQRQIAKDFEARSKVCFCNCGGCIDGILLWIEKPTKADCEMAGVDSGKFYCARKAKYGLNMQAVCDARRRFLDVSIRNPGSASDFLSYATSNLFKNILTPGFLAAGIQLFGDNAYVSTSCMVTPFPNVSSGVHDDYNFYHSQVRVNIECSFGMLTNRWRILKTPMSNVRLPKVTALVMALCRLHNFCIDEDSANVPM
jgi:DDE superfamily endonuclease